MTTSSRASFVRLAALPVLLAALAACGTPVDEGPKPTLAGADTILKTAPTFYGAVVTDGAGRTLYQFTSDQSGRPPACAGSCQTAWPPYIAAGEPRVDDPTLSTLQTARIATVSRSDAQSQVSYQGHPLYYFAGDKKPGDALGAGLTQFGGRWFPVTTNGGPVVP